MHLTAFRISMFKCILDSGRVPVEHLTALVGKNEAGKTSLLKALHRFNPFLEESYNLDRDWPRGHRDKRSADHQVCTAEFALDATEHAELKKITNYAPIPETVTITRDYQGRIEVAFPPEIAPDKLHPTDVDAALKALPSPPGQAGELFRQSARECLAEARRCGLDGRFSDLEALHEAHSQKLNAALTAGNPEPQHQQETNFINAYIGKLGDVAKRLRETPSIHRTAHDYVAKRLPTFVYMDEYRAFRGTAMLDELKQRNDKKAPSEEDKTILTILSLSGLSLDKLVAQGQVNDREQRRYDLSDAALTLVNKIRTHWGQLRYEVQFDADGQQFFTFVKDERDRALIKLEERSRGFQWFFSFDLLLMHETKGSMKGCVILLDEPGLHLHPEGQKNLLERLEAYAEGNTLIYTTHLPFMLDLQRPERIRVISETDDKGTTVAEDLTKSQPDGKLTIQAALGISGRQSFLVAEQNLVVEGVDDYWIVTAVSNLFKRSGRQGLPDYVLITPAGGASEVTYIATFMTGQQLDVVALYDTDPAGNAAKDNFVKKWLARYSASKATALSLGATVGETQQEFSIEDLFPESFYLTYVKQTYVRQLAGSELALGAGPQLCKRVEKAFESATNGLHYNKGSVAKRLCSAINRMKDVSELPEDTIRRSEKLFTAINEALPPVSQ